MTYTYGPSYPTPPQTGSASLQATPNPGLGLYACSIASTHSGARGLPPSPQPSELWTQSSIAEQTLPTTSQPTNIFSEAYDPFSTLHSTTTSACMSTTFTSAPCDAPSLTQSPGLSGHTRQSLRSSISSSCAPSDVYLQPSSGITFTPKVKMEDSDDWYSNSSHAGSLLQKTLSPQVLSTIAQEHVSPFSRPFYLLESNDGPSERSARHSDSTRHLTERDHNELYSSPDERRPKSGQDQCSVTTALRMKKRQRTTPEDATHECRVCGQLFRRSYNWKSHMDIHNPVRNYPHPCQEPDCQKKFTRKTDLDRHHESVSLLYSKSAKCVTDWLKGTFEEEKLPLWAVWKSVCAQGHVEEVSVLSLRSTS